MGVVGRLDQYASMLCNEFDDYSMSENLFTYSEQFDNASWLRNNYNVTANAIQAPDGTLTADKLIAINASTFHDLYKSPSLGFAPYTLSIFAKAAEQSFIQLRIDDGVLSRVAMFNLLTGSVTSSSNVAVSTITSYPNGWYRCSIAARTSIVNAVFNGFPTSSNVNYSGDGVSGIYIWGAQLEGGTITDYTPTTTTAINRVLTSTTNTNITGLGTYYSSGFDENIGFTTFLPANISPPYNPVYDEFGGTFFGAGQGRYMRQNTDKSVIVYNEIDEVTDFYGRGNIVRDGLILDLDAGIRASYPGSGTTWTDLSNNNTSATIVGNQVVYSPINGGVFNFTGSNGPDPDYVSIPNTSIILGANFTIEVWNYYDTASPPPDNPWQAGLWTNSATADWNGGAGNNNGLVFGYNAMVYVNTSASQVNVIYSSNPASRVWHQHVLVVNSGVGAVYVDRSIVANLSNMRTYTQSNGVLAIGVADIFGNYRGEYFGYISNAKIYNRALTSAEITQN